MTDPEYFFLFYKFKGPGPGLGPSLDLALFGLVNWSGKGMAHTRTTLCLFNVVQDLRKALGVLVWTIPFPDQMTKPSRARSNDGPSPGPGP